MGFILIIVVAIFSIRPLVAGFSSGLDYIEKSKSKIFDFSILVMLSLIIPVLILTGFFALFATRELYEITFSLSIFFFILCLNEVVGAIFNYRKLNQYKCYEVIKPAANIGAVAFPFVWLYLGEPLALLFNIEWVF